MPMTPRTLYIVNKPTTGDWKPLLPSSDEDDDAFSLVLLQDAVAIDEPLGRFVYVLDEDCTARNVISTFPTVSYADLVRMIFEAETVVAI